MPISTTGPIPANTTVWNGTAVAASDTAGYPKATIKAGSGTGEVLLTAGAVTVGTNNDKTAYSLTAGSYVVRASSNQRGTVSVTSATSNTTALPISSVTLTRAKLMSGGFDTNSGAGSMPPGDQPYQTLQATTVTQTRGAAGGDTTISSFDVEELF